MKTVTQRLMDLFRGFAGASGTHGAPDRDPDGLKWNIKRTARTLRVPVTEELWVKHLKGERPLGVIPIREDNSCSWGSIDFDEYDVDLRELIVRVERSRLPLVPCRSKSGGLHLFLFLTEPVPAAEVLSALRDAAASLGMAECEVFPKQTKVLLDRSDLGNWMVMPYYGDTFGGKLQMQHGLKKTGAEMTLEEFVRHCEKHKTTMDEFVKLCVVRRMPSAAKKGSKSEAKPRANFADGPPCLQHLVTSGVKSDGRKRTMFHMGVYYKRAFQSEWKERLEQANREYFSPPLPAAEVDGVIRSLEKKDYEYTCKEEPMRSHCDAIKCRMRKFGVGRGGEYPTISSISKLETTPPIWFVDVEGERLELTTDELQNYVRFHRVCMERVGKCFMVVSQAAWWSTLAEAMANLTLVPAPPDVGAFGRFRELLEEFLTNRSRGQRQEDLWSGRPWEDAERGRHYFTLRALQKFLSQEGAKDFNRGQITRYVAEMGGEHEFINLKFGGRQNGLNTWWIPADKVQGAPTLDPPDMKEDEI